MSLRMLKILNVATATIAILASLAFLFLIIEAFIVSNVLGMVILLGFGIPFSLIWWTFYNLEEER